MLCVSEHRSEAIELWEKLVAESPTNQDYRLHLGWSRNWLRDLLDPTQTHSYAKQIEALLAQNKRFEAERSIREVFEKIDEARTTHPEGPDVLRSQADFQRQLANLQAAGDRFDEAEKSYRDALQSYQTIIAANGHEVLRG